MQGFLPRPTQPFISLFTRSGAALLHEIGRRFNDSLAARGGGAYRIKLQQPVAYRPYSRASATCEPQRDSLVSPPIWRDIRHQLQQIHLRRLHGTRRSFEDLKNMLAEIVDGLRDEGRCFVKHERRQACFHITARSENSNKTDNNITETDTPR